MASTSRPEDHAEHVPSPSRYSAAQFLTALILLLSASPLLEDLAQGDLIETLLLTLVLVSAVPALGGNRRILLVGCLLGLPAVAGKWLHHLNPGLMPISPILAVTIAFTIFVVAHHLRFILSAAEVDTQVLCAGVSTFLMLGLVWAFGYLLLDNIAADSLAIQMGPDSTNRLNTFTALYFSFGTMCGLSYGEITPVSNASRMMALLESTTSLFYFAILLSRLVALHTERAIQK